MRFSVIAGLVLLIISSRGYSQNYDGRNDYIFNQTFVTRITESDASALVKVKDAGQVFWNLYEQMSKATALPRDVTKTGDRLVFEVAGRPKLSLKSYVYKGKDDSGDSQRFSYVSEFAKYHLVVVEFSHDRPCFMLVDRETLKVYFVDYTD